MRFVWSLATVWVVNRLPAGYRFHLLVSAEKHRMKQRAQYDYWTLVLRPGLHAINLIRKAGTLSTRKFSFLFSSFPDSFLVDDAQVLRACKPGIVDVSRSKRNRPPDERKRPINLTKFTNGIKRNGTAHPRPPGVAADRDLDWYRFGCSYSSGSGIQ